MNKCPRCKSEGMRRSAEDKKKQPNIPFDYFCPHCGCFYNYIEETGSKK